MKQSEAAEQAEIIRWAKALERRVPVLGLLHCSLNGVRLSPGQARAAVRAGMKRGVPDLFLPVPTKLYNGLFLEVKTRKGRLSKHQVRWKRLLEEQGYKVVVPRAWWEARNAIVSYLRGER